MKRAGINYVEEITYMWDEKRLYSIKGFGKSKLKELKEHRIEILKK